MLNTTLIALFTRDLNRLIAEIDAYTTEEALWITTPAISNCGGNLCLHIIGNLNAFVGAEIGKTGYVRDRDLEFSQKGIRKTVLIEHIQETLVVVETVLQSLTATDFKSPFSRRAEEAPMTLEYFLIHLLAHLSYHLGQINYHRRLLSN